MSVSSIINSLIQINIYTVMENIYEPNEKFVFDNLVLTTPKFVSNGNYCIKYIMNDLPLYIQPPKCTIKQGIIKGGKKMYCDLLFTNENEKFIKWIEELENYSQKYIFDNRAKWFESDLEMHDIENSFTSPLKLYKSGKFYIVRTIIPTRLGKCTLKLFDEGESDITIDNIKDESNVITIWEIQGIKCSAKSFQIEIEIKQMMILTPQAIFEHCIIKGRNGKEPNTDFIKDKVLVNKVEDTNYIKEEDTNDIKEENTVEDTNDINAENTEEDTNDINAENTEEDIPSYIKEENQEVIIKEENQEVIIKEEQEPVLLEIDISVEDIDQNENIQLRNRNDVYYEMYMTAKQKAEEARNLAISSYLEVKRIKDLYLIEKTSSIHLSS